MIKQHFAVNPDDENIFGAQLLRPYLRKQKPKPRVIEMPQIQYSWSEFCKCNA